MRLQPRKSPILAAALALVLLLAPDASARRYQLGWSESTAGLNVPAAMLFKVKWVSISGSNWTVSASFKNLSRKTLDVILKNPYPNDPRQTFALSGNTQTCTGCTALPLPLAYPSRFAPALPKLLPPGKTWTGTFSGTAHFKRHQYLWVTFGYFRVHGADFRTHNGAPFYHLTPKAFRL